MSRNRRQGGVRGPASALTSFLAGLGVEPAAGLTTWGNTSDITAQANDQPDHTVDPAGAVTARNVEAGPTEVGEGTPEAGPSGTGSVATDDIDDRPTKRARATSVDSDDLDADAPPTPPIPARSNGKAPSAGVKPEPLKAAGEFMPCGECTKRFTVTAYTKEHPKQPSTWLCVQCCYALGINPFEKAKKSKAKAAPQKKEDRAKIVHYDTKKGTLALSEICINIIGQYIEDVDQLGDIGSVNLDKVCRIISKSRKLAPETAGLFYSIDRKNLAMYDCTRLLPESFLTLANLCPNLETLKLDLCGQLSTDGLKHWGQNLKQLHRLELLGPFLVRKDGWNEFFQSVGSRLTGILVTQSPRIDLEVIQTLVDNCPDLVELRLSEVGQMCDELAAPLAKLSKLESLDLSAPGTSLNDVAVIALLSSIGGNLKHLNLNDNTELSDDILPAILDHCTELRSLHLKNLALTDTAVAEFFTSLSAKGRHGLSVIDLEKGHDLGDAALNAVIKHSGSTVENLSILGWRTASKAALEQLAKCSALRELNIGWCREVTDFVIKDILDGCEHLKSMRVWGCNQLTDAVPRKKGVKVIGIESHTI